MMKFALQKANPNLPPTTPYTPLPTNGPPPEFVKQPSGMMTPGPQN